MKRIHLVHFVPFVAKLRANVIDRADRDSP
jgi:hypothetical protein